MPQEKSESLPSTSHSLFDFWKRSQHQMVLMFFMGFTSGLPLALRGSTLQAWMKTDGVDLKTIGFFSLAGLPYTIKFLWAPFMDRFTPALFGRQLLGRRRGWMLLTQLGLVVAIWSMGAADPKNMPFVVAALAVLLSFLGASQDIAIDAYRAERLTAEERSAGVGISVIGYRIAMIASGAGALVLAEYLSWQHVYLIMGSLLSIGIVTTIIAAEPPVVAKPRSLQAAVVEPFKEFFGRRIAKELLLFIVLYKLGDVLAVALMTPFLLEIGYTKLEIGAVAKGLGLGASLLGGLVAGVYAAKMGTFRALVIFGVLQGISVVSFAFLAASPHSRVLLSVTMGFEHFCNGLGTTVFTAFLMQLCNPKFTATQFALLTSLTAVTRELMGPVAAFLAVSLGWVWFFIFCTILALPGLFLVYRRGGVWLAEENLSFQSSESK